MNTKVILPELTENDIGRWVIYHVGKEDQEEGRIKDWNENYVFVVYKCNNSWNKFKEYTGVATLPEDLNFKIEKEEKIMADEDYGSDTNDIESTLFGVVGLIFLITLGIFIFFSGRWYEKSHQINEPIVAPVPFMR